MCIRDSVCDAADGLNFPFLVDRTCHRQILTDGQFCQRGQDAVKFCTGCAVPVNAVVILLEADTVSYTHLVRPGVPVRARRGRYRGGLRHRTNRPCGTEP